MKKIIALTALFGLVSSMAFAANPTGYNSAENGVTLGGTGTPASPNLSVKSSKGVSINFKGGAADSNSHNQSYSLGAYHASGTKTYATSSGDTKIYYQDTTAVDTPGAPAAASDTASFTGSWKAL